ncbi:MAG: bifunctional phosphopantothenoylcysteine decarboxylase/phosphopantothenate--cysteine ligase CoaBC [Chloroflexota bacterium]
MTLLSGKRIVLAVTGSIAVYKSVDLASKLTQAGAEVDVIMTEAAQRFVAPLTFQSVTGRAVYTHLWETESSGDLPTHIAHVGMGEGADLLAVIPATAHTIARLATGMADDLLTITALATQAPLLLAPAMDGSMYQHPAMYSNLRTLRQRDAYIVEPDTGRFASGLVGQGRLPDTPTLIGHMRLLLGQDGVLAGRRIVVTAGGTREPLDPVRYITNHSSGKQGYAIAQAALDAGADVTLISSANLTAPIGADVVPVATAVELRDAVVAAATDADVLVMAAAVADYRPATVAEQKIKKSDSMDDGITVEMVRNPDILMDVKALRNTNGYPRVVVGFAAESENLMANARSKLMRKGLDMLVANDITAKDAGFAVDTNRVTILSDEHAAEPMELQTKAQVAEVIIDRIAALLDT